MKPAKKPARTALEAAGIAAALLAGAWLLFRATLYAPAPPQRAGAQAVEPRPEEAIVVSVTGDVVRLSPGAAPSLLQAGQRLRPDDSVRTGRGARTDLEIGGRSRLTVAEGTQLTVREITERVHRFRLSRGRIAVDYQADGERVLRIESDSGDTVAETKAARFGMLSTGASVAIATDTGVVRLIAPKGTVDVGPGTQARATADRPPSAAEPIPARLLLKIADAPAARESGDLCLDLEGTAPAGSELHADGVEVPLSADGHFALRVPRTADKSVVVLELRDASGRGTRRSVPCATETAAAPNIRGFAIRWTQKRRP